MCVLACECVGVIVHRCMYIYVGLWVSLSVSESVSLSVSIYEFL